MQLLQDYFEGKLERDADIQMRNSVSEKKMLIKNVGVCFKQLPKCAEKIQQCIMNVKLISCY